MNIEIANRLVNLRKQNNLSQEALAEKLGISRQAVSKWERAEASPDTDNLIMLARIYDLSLDSLLQTEDEIPVIEENILNSEEDEIPDEYVHVGLGGVHVKDKDGSEVHVGWNGIHVEDKNGKDSVHIGKDSVYVNGEHYTAKDWIYHHHFPIDMIVVIAYIIMGVMWNLWHPGWLIFFIIPIWHSVAVAIRHKNLRQIAYPLITIVIFISLGIFKNLWHPGWIVFLTIPIYYSLVSYLQYLGKKKQDKQFD